MALLRSTSYSREQLTMSHAQLQLGMFACSAANFQRAFHRRLIRASKNSARKAMKRYWEIIADNLKKRG
jgi:hypothetical protein